MTEFWKDIPEYKGLYQASSIGRIRRLDRKIINHGTLSVKRGAIICQSKSKKGYIRVRLFFNGGTKEELVHRLIAKYVHRDHTSMLHLLKKYDDETRYNPNFRVLAQRVDNILKQTSDAKA